jgi:hypothetical protein
MWPAKYDATMPERAYQILVDGGSRSKVCAQLKICRQTLLDWEAKHPAFKRAMQMGHDAAQAAWEDIGHDGIIADGFNTANYIIQMRNRFGWRATDPKEPEESDKSMTAVLTEAFVAAQAAINEVNKMQDK